MPSPRGSCGSARGTGRTTRPDHGEGDELRPHDREPRAAIQDGLGKHDEMRGRRRQHDGLDELRHAFARRHAAGQHLAAAAAPGSAAGRTAASSARRWRGRCPSTWWRTGAAPRRPGTAATDPSIGTASTPCTTNASDSAAATSTTSGHRPDLARHDLERRHRHHQQVLDRAVLALADQRGAGQHDRQHGDVVDDLHHRAEPATCSAPD